MRIDSSRWRVVSDSPVKFVKSKGCCLCPSQRWGSGFKSTKQPAELRFYTLLNEEAPEVSWQWGGTAGAAKKRRLSSLGRS